MELASFPGSTPQLFAQYEGVELRNSGIVLSYKPLKIVCVWSVTLWHVT